MTNAENKDDFHADSSPANDNDSNKAPVTVTSAAGALASVSLAALKVALNGVDTMSGRSDHQTMLFKARLGDGTYVFGPKQTAPEEGSRWAFNPATFQRGYVCFSDSGKKLGERLLPVTQPMLDRATLPDTGFPWAEEWTVNMKCLDGSDAGDRAHLQDQRRSAAFRPSVTSCSARSATGSMATSTTARWCRSRSWKRTATKTSTARNGIRSSASSIGWR